MTKVGSASINTILQKKLYLGTLSEVSLLYFRKHLKRIPSISMWPRILEATNDRQENFKILAHGHLQVIIRCKNLINNTRVVLANTTYFNHSPLLPLFSKW